MSSTRHDHPHLPAPRVVEVSDGVYAYLQPDGSWWINNTGFLVGRRGVASIDACSTERRTRAYLAAVEKVSRQPVRTVVNTHHHGDHTFGNYLFRTATIVGHERTRQEALAFGAPFSAPFWEEVEWGDIEVEPPFLTFTDAVTLHVDDLRVEVRHVGTAAHTTNDSIVWIPERKVLFSGDLLFNGGTPFLLMGSVTGALSVLEDLRGLGAETIVPGHGDIAGPGVIDDVARYITYVLDLAGRGHAAGLSPLELARETDLGEFAGLTDRERIVGNLHRAYAELDGLEPGGTIDLAAALTDMVAYNGGRPLSCLA
ncbi:MAG: beta-lactamase protein [Streptosporangiaceae bacterium]|nr:beta-lactamase protein [Streptosporangiaceae bacterium]